MFEQRLLDVECLECHIMTPHGQPEPCICDKFLEQLGNRSYENLYRVNSCENHTVKRVERVDETSCELHARVLGHGPSTRVSL